jgi:type I restriction enzyme S subunit
VIDLAPRWLDEVRAIVARHVPDCEVRAFGSRVSGRAKPWSDLDLALMTSRPVPFQVLAALRLDFDESDLPFRVDVVDRSRLGESFRRVVDAATEVARSAGAR